MYACVHVANVHTCVCARMYVNMYVFMYACTHASRPMFTSQIATL